MDIPPPPLDRTASGQSEEAALAYLSESLGAEFEILRRLGVGSMATVYLAREVELGRLVAVKVLLPGQARDETARRRFEREAKAAAALSHPHVVHVFRYGRLPDQTPYLVMRYVKGRTMEERLKAEGRLDVVQAKEVLHDVCSALAAAHAQGIVHRDLRPANILWDEEGGCAYLSDFGIAALISTGGEDVTRLTKTGQTVGDPRYLSPEQLLDQELTTLSDMYSVGILGYELYTGEGPYGAKSNTQWITAHLSSEPRPLVEMRPDADPRVADLLLRCLAREPKHRPSAADVARVLSGEPAPASLAALGSGSVEEAADLQQLIKRRVPQIVFLSIAGGYGLLSVIETILGNESIVFLLALPFVGCAVAVANVIAWFHGERGKQEASVLEWIMLSVIGVIWITVSAGILILR